MNIKNNKEVNDKENKSSIKMPSYISKGVIVLVVTNIVFLVATFFLLSKLRELSLQHRELRNSMFDRTTTEDLAVLEFELDSNSSALQKISNSFPDETGLLEFISGVEKFKTSGTVVGLSFTSKEPVKDKLGNMGIPVIVEFQGDWEAILYDLRQILQLPYVFRPVKFEAEKKELITEESGTSISQSIQASFGGFLYVNEKFSGNR